MNSKQINFFITPDDKEKILDFLKAKGCLFLQENVAKPQEALNNNINIITENIFKVYLVREDLKENVMFKHLDSKNIFYVDILKSCVVELNLGGFYPDSDKELYRGRLYYISKYYDDDGTVVSKIEFFKNWADGIIKDFKKAFLKKFALYSESYFSQNAIEWIENNKAKKALGGLKFIIENE